MSINDGSGHGQGVPRADGARARCGGPGLCSACSAEKAALDAAPASGVTGAPPPPIDVEALKLDLANAQAELGRLGHELGKLRGDLQVALRLSGTATDEELVAAADRPTPAEYAALQASRDEARGAEAHWKTRADERAAESLAREQEVRQARERAATAEAACRRMLESLPEDIRSRTGSTLLEQLESSVREVRPTLKALRERADKAERELDDRRKERAEALGVLGLPRAEPGMLAELVRQRLEVAHQDASTEAEMEGAEAERFLEASRRDAESLRRELAAVKARMRQAKEAARLDPDISDEGLLKRIRAWCERVRACECQRLEAQVDSLGTRARVAEVELAGALAQLEKTQVERDRARAVAEGLRRENENLRLQVRVATATPGTNQPLVDDLERWRAEVELEFGQLKGELDALKADRRWTAADALRARLRRVEALSANRLRRWEEAVAEVEQLKAELAQRPLNPIDPEALRRLRRRAKPLLDGLTARAGHVCDVWKPVAENKPDGQWVCETCGKPFESWVEPEAKP